MSRSITRGHRTSDAVSVTLHEMPMESPSASEVRELIARRAYELYKQRAPEFGDEMSDWLQAEGEVVAILLGERPETSETSIAIDQPARRSTRPVKTAKPTKEARQQVTRRPK